MSGMQSGQLFMPLDWDIGDGPRLQPCPQATMPAPHCLQTDPTPLDTSPHCLYTPLRSQRTFTRVTKGRDQLQLSEHLYPLKTRRSNAWAPYPDTPETPRTPEGSRHSHNHATCLLEPPAHEVTIHRAPPIFLQTIIACS